MNFSRKQIVVSIALLVVGLIGGVLVACTATGGPDEAAEVAKIEVVYDEYAATVNDGGFERYMALWDDDAIQLSPDAPDHINKEQIREVMQPVFDSFNQTAAINTEEVQILGEQAYAFGTFEITVTPKDGGDTLVLNGQFLDILAKQEDGSWKIAIDCHNFYMPPE